MVLQKWNQYIRNYEPFDSPAKKVFLISDNMDSLIDCAECGKEVRYGQTYTSRQIHTSIGLGYPVCGDCYTNERK